MYSAVRDNCLLSYWMDDRCSIPGRSREFTSPPRQDRL